MSRFPFNHPHNGSPPMEGSSVAMYLNPSTKMISHKVLLWLPSEGNGNLWAPFMPKQALDGDRWWSLPIRLATTVLNFRWLPLTSGKSTGGWGQRWEWLDGVWHLVWSESTWPLHCLGSESLGQQVNISWHTTSHTKAGSNISYGECSSMWTEERDAHHEWWWYSNLRCISLLIIDLIVVKM